MVRQAFILVVVSASLVAQLGCGDMQVARERARDTSTPRSKAAPADYQLALQSAARGRMSEGGSRSGQSIPTPSQKIIYEAEITLIVNDVEQLEVEMTKLVKQFGGFVADASVDRSMGEQLSGRWRVRIPVTHFDEFLNLVSKLGIPESRSQTAQDVSEEFVDLEARITNQKRLEERIVKLLEDPNGEIKDVIEVERELARVRGTIEQMEGRLRYLTNRTDLTTVNISAREEQNYVPPEAPTFAARVRQAWNNSLLALRTFGEQLAVATVAAVPWVVVASVVLTPGWWYVRRRRHLK